MQDQVKRLRVLLVVAVLILNLFMVGLLAYAVSTAKDRKVAEVRTNVENLALLLDQSVTAAANDIDLSLGEIERNLERELQTSSGQHGNIVPSKLPSLSENWVSQLAEIRITDATGKLIVGHGVVPGNLVSYADREFFITHRTHSDSGMIVSKLLFGRISKRWVNVYSRRYNYPHGQFAGVIAAAVPANHYEKLLSGLNLGPSGIALLRDTDKSLIARYPPTTAASGQTGARGGSKEVTEILASGVKSATFFTAQSASGIARTDAFRRIAGTPIYVVVGMGEDDYLMEWRNDRRKAAALAVFFLLVSTLAATLLWRLIDSNDRANRRSSILLKNSSDGIHILDRDGCLIEGSESFFRMLGYSRSEMIGLGPLHWDTSLSPTQLRTLLDRQFESKDVCVFESTHRRKDGSTFAVEITGIVVELDGQSVLFNASRDISGRKQAEVALRDSEERYRTAFLTSPDAVTMTRLCDGLYLDVNGGFQKMLGWTREESVGRTSLDMNIWHKPHDRQVFVDGLHNGGHCENFEARLVSKNGRVVFTLISAHVLVLKGQSCILSVTRDITKRKATEDQLRKLSQALEQSSDSVIITDTDATIEYVNEAFVRRTGFSREQIMGKNPRMLQSGSTSRETYTAMWNALLNGRPWTGEFFNQDRDGTPCIQLAVISPIRQPDGHITHYVAVLSDITEKKRAEDQINSLAFFDSLTELPNRRLLLDRLKQAAASSARLGHYCALLFIDLDDFKMLNDTRGHDVGDLLLQQTALRLTHCVRVGDTVARVGGDEFVLLLESLSVNAQDAASGAKAVAEKIIEAINEPYQLAGGTCHSSPSIGIALFSDHWGSLDELLKQADLAMYRAKESGRNTMRFFEPEMQAAVTARAALESDLREAVEKGQFLLHYQAQVGRSGVIAGVEALLRWQHPQRGAVSPMNFIPLAESTGLIVPIGRWVLETACLQLSAWAGRMELCGLTIAVNVSARQFYQPDFVAQVLSILERTGANPTRLKLELTESLLVSSIEEVIDKMHTLKAIGVGFSLDDFGTGYSSLYYLKRMPLDQLKIDQSFVRDILTDPNDAAIAKMVIVLARSMGLSVIAEGVETVPQRDFLAVQGCHCYQGYLFSRPLPIREFEELALNALSLMPIANQVMTAIESEPSGTYLIQILDN